MEQMEKKPFLSLLERFLAAEISDFIVSLPVKTRSRLDEFPRIIFMDSGELDCNIGQDGAVTTVHLPPKAVLFGLNGSCTGCSEHNEYDGSTFTIGFFPDYIRFVYYSFHRGQAKNSFFFHSSEPAGAACLMALESLQNIALKPDMRAAQCHLVKAILAMIRVQLFERETEKIGKSAISWQKVESYVATHLTDDTLSRKTLAKIFRLNECYLSSLCRKNTNHTLKDFIIRKKLAYAVLLLEQNKTIGEIADECGFRQTGYFIQVFRKIYGLSPGKYRTNAWNRQ